MPNIAAVGKVIKGVAALSALMPGVAMIVKAMPIPPHLDTIMIALSLAMGTVVVIFVFLLQDKLQSMPPIRLASFVILVAIVGVLSTVFYAQFAESHIRNNPNTEEPYLVPIFPSPELQTIMNDFDKTNYDSALISPRETEVEELLKSDQLLTELILVSLLLVGQSLIIVAIVAGGWKIAAIFVSSKSPESSEHAADKN